MSADSERQFVLTSVLIYGHDTTAGDKHLRAKELMSVLWSSGNGCLSVQVLQEFYLSLKRKVRQPLEAEVADGTWRT
jgi:predicted nucleic acid-binding protein